MSAPPCHNGAVECFSTAICKMGSLINDHLPRPNCQWKSRHSWDQRSTFLVFIWKRNWQRINCLLDTVFIIHLFLSSTITNLIVEQSSVCWKNQLDNISLAVMQDSTDNSCDLRKSASGSDPGTLFGSSSRNVFLASQDALEVMLVSESVSQWVTLRTKLTDVALVSEDINWRLYWWDTVNWWYLWRWC